MQIQQQIERKIRHALHAEHLDIRNESDKHNVPAGSESHFKVTLVSDTFADMSKVQRHRYLNKLLAEELAGPVHALSLHLFTPPEWAQRQGQVAETPDCAGGDGSLPKR